MRAVMRQRTPRDGTRLARVRAMRDPQEDLPANASDDNDGELEIEVELEDRDDEGLDRLADDEVEDIELDDLTAMEGPDA
jgi:hypothetical protein